MRKQKKAERKCISDDCDRKIHGVHHIYCTLCRKELFAKNYAERAVDEAFEKKDC